MDLLLDSQDSPQCNSQMTSLPSDSQISSQHVHIGGLDTQQPSLGYAAEEVSTEGETVAADPSALHNNGLPDRESGAWLQLSYIERKGYPRGCQWGRVSRAI